MNTIPLGALLTTTVALAATALGCAASTTESHWTFAPEKPKDCELLLLQPDQRELTRGGYEILGQVTLRDGDPSNPFDKKYRDAVHPRACAMGGEAVAVPVPGLNQGGIGARDLRSGKLVYTVVRLPKSPPIPPQKF